MKVVIQRARKARVEVDGKTIGKIERGLVVFLAIGKSDTAEQVKYLVKKILALRIFEKGGKIDKSVVDHKYELLIISQFTLYANALKGNRVSFMDAAEPKRAKELYEDFIDQIKAMYTPAYIQSGEFGANMMVYVENDGPFTLCLEH